MAMASEAAIVLYCIHHQKVPLSTKPSYYPLSNVGGHWGHQRQSTPTPKLASRLSSRIPPLQLLSALAASNVDDVPPPLSPGVFCTK